MKSVFKTPLLFELYFRLPWHIIPLKKFTKIMKRMLRFGKCPKWIFHSDNLLLRHPRTCLEVWRPAGIIYPRGRGSVPPC